VTAPGTVVVVGATSGIGRAAAGQLAALGHRVIAVGRDERRGKALLADLGTRAPAPHEFVPGDVSTAAGVARVADRVRDLTGTVDVLINAAGLVAPKREVSADGVELNLAVHHLAPWSMTGLLLPLLRAGSGRVVNINSEGHRTTMTGRGVDLDLDDLGGERHYEPWLAYSRSKLANLLFTGELHRRHPELGVVALHPGMVRTRIGRSFPRAKVAALLLFAVSARQGAKPVVRLATDPAVSNGAYYDRFAPATPSAAARDRAKAQRLWLLTEELRGPFGH
jgi:NAD(P)-dependent dehydrogenase (short-subunit alcohol dehydrogenase family)